MRLGDHGDHVKPEVERRYPHVDRLLADSQALYDQVLRGTEGRSLTEVRDLLARERRSKFGTDMPEPDLSRNAEVLARGERV